MGLEQLEPTAIGASDPRRVSGHFQAPAVLRPLQCSYDPRRARAIRILCAARSGAPLLDSLMSLRGVWCHFDSPRRSGSCSTAQ